MTKLLYLFTGRFTGEIEEIQRERNDVLMRVLPIYPLTRGARECKEGGSSVRSAGHAVQTRLGLQARRREGYMYIGVMRVTSDM